MSSRSDKDAFVEEILDFVAKTYNADLYHLERKILRLSQRLDTLEEQTLRLSQAQEAMEEKVLRFSQRQDAIEEKNTRLSRRQDALEEENSALKKTVAKLISDLHTRTTTVEAIQSKLGEWQGVLENLQVEVAETVIDTSHLEDEQTGLTSKVKALAISEETTKSRLQTLETAFEVSQRKQREFMDGLQQFINILGRGRKTSRDVTPEHDRGAYASQLDNQDQQQGFQLDNQVFGHQRGPQDFESDDELEVTDFTHMVETHDDFTHMVETHDDDQAMMDVQDYESVTLHDHDQDIDDGERKVWLDDYGILQTNDQDPDDTWDELEATWDIQKAKFEAITKEEGELAWMSVDFDKYSKKCLWSAVHRRTHYWTNSEAGSFACKACANNRVICFGNNNGRWEALPLPNEVVEDNPSIKQKYISYRNTISKSRQAIGVWPDS